MGGYNPLVPPFLGSFHDDMAHLQAAMNPDRMQKDPHMKWVQMHSQAQKLQAMADQLDQGNPGLTRAEIEAMADQVRQMHNNVELLLQADARKEAQPFPVMPASLAGAAYMQQPQERLPVNGQRPAATAATGAGNVGRSPKAAAGKKQDGGNFGSLRNFLNELRAEDARCIFIARGIKQLGFKSNQALERHFSTYGEVSHVFVPTSKTKANLRPGNLGVVVMKSPDDVDRIMAASHEQVIKGVQIEVSLYERPTFADDSQEVEAHPKRAVNLYPEIPKRQPAQQYKMPDSSWSGCGPVMQPAQLNANAQLPCAANSASPEILSDVARQLTQLQSALTQINNVSKRPEKIPQEELFRAMATLGDAQQHLGKLGQSCRQMALAGGHQQVHHELDRAVPSFPEQHLGNPAGNHVTLVPPWCPDPIAGFPQPAPDFQRAASEYLYPPPVMPPPGALGPMPMHPHLHGGIALAAAMANSMGSPLIDPATRQAGKDVEPTEEEIDGINETCGMNPLVSNASDNAAGWNRFTSPQESYWN